MWTSFLDVAHASAQGFHTVFSWPNILYPTAATFLAMVCAFVPGIGSVTLMALAISLTFSWDVTPVMLIFGAFTGGATFMGSITAILFNIPGTAPNAATLIDGHPMALQGKAKTAIACSAAASALGSTVGIFILILLLPALRGMLLAFGPAELLVLVLWGLVTVAAAARGSLRKGMVTAGLGLLLSFVGFDHRTAELRFTFGLPSLQDGLHIVPVFLGVFAIAEVLALAVRDRATITERAQLSGSVREGVLAVFQNFGLFLRSAIMGTVVGMIPAAGGTVASFLAYGQAVQSSKDRSKFGHGDIRGVLAPEAAHDAKDGGSLAPTLALGLPGSEGTSVLLAALTLHGLVPGKAMLSEHLATAFVLIWSLFYSNWLTSILGLSLAPLLAKLSISRVARFAPFLILSAVVGAFVQNKSFGDVVVAFGFGIVGYYLRKHGWPLVPFVTALVLGPVFESNFHLVRSLTSAGRLDVWTRPIVWMLIASGVSFLVWPRVRTKLQQLRPEAGRTS